MFDDIASGWLDARVAVINYCSSRGRKLLIATGTYLLLRFCSHHDGAPPCPPTLTPNKRLFTKAWNYLGAASELAGRGTQAVAAYRRALGLLEEQGQRFRAAAGAGEEWEELVRLARVNLGRALVLAGQAEEAVSFLGGGDSAQVTYMLLLLLVLLLVMVLFLVLVLVRVLVCGLFRLEQ